MLASLEALSVNNGGSRLLVLFLGDPHAGEGRDGREDRSSDPDAVLSFGDSNDLDLGSDVLGGEFLDFLSESFGEAGEEGSSSGEDDVLVEVLSDIDIGLGDGLEALVVDSRELLADEGGLEEDFGASESLGAEGHHGTVGHLVVGFLGSAGLGLVEFLVEVKSSVAELLFDVLDDFSLGGGGEMVASLGHDLEQVVGQVSSGQVDSQDRVGQRVSVENGHQVGHTVSGVADDTGELSGGVEGQHGLDGDVKSGHVEGVEHDLGHLLSVDLGVQGRLGQHDVVLFRGHSQLVGEGVVPDLLHIIPVLDDTVLDRVLQDQDSSLLLGLAADVVVLTLGTDHDSRNFGSSDDGREDGSRPFFSRKSGLAVSGSDIDD